MTDLHIHMLPGMDDGAKNMEEALEMADLAAVSGVHLLVVTPHGNLTKRTDSQRLLLLKETFALLQKEVQKEKIPVRLLLGMESMAVDGIAEKIQKREVFPLHQSRCYLIEVPFDMAPEAVGEQLMEVKRTGNIPVLAHPERYFCVQDMPELLYEWKKTGALFQVNQGSIFGRFGREEERTADFLLRHHLADCVASDAHGSRRRRPDLGRTKKYLEARFSSAYADFLLQECPERILTQGYAIRYRAVQKSTAKFRVYQKPKKGEEKI